jgi:hypothetical protein
MDVAAMIAAPIEEVLRYLITYHGYSTVRDGFADACRTVADEWLARNNDSAKADMWELRATEIENVG